jgi:ABC-type lipoprotein export system ATPase subunit
MAFFLKTEDIHKSFRLGKADVSVLRGVNLEIEKGEWVALLGASGSGKTTLLDILGTLARPDLGEVFCDGQSYSKMGRYETIRFRNRKIGFIFQAYHMFPELSITENVVLPARLNSGISGKEANTRSISLLERVGLKHRIEHRPNELSGGEQQRAAIARALINSPEIILADEPTGNLDSETGKGILSIFQELHQSEAGMTMVMVTHDHEVAALADRIVELRDGVII